MDLGTTLRQAVSRIAGFSLGLEAKRILEDANNTAIDFNVGSVHIDGSLLRHVATAIAESKLQIAYIPTQSRDRFFYNWRANVFELPVATLEDTSYKALFIHEAVHAGLDLSKASQIRTVSDEAAAYIAQCVWAVQRNMSQRMTGDALKDAIFREAFALAKRVIARQALNDSDVEPLRNSIRNHPMYANGAEIAVGYDG